MNQEIPNPQLHFLAVTLYQLLVDGEELSVGSHEIGVDKWTADRGLHQQRQTVSALEFVENLGRYAGRSGTVKEDITCVELRYCLEVHPTFLAEVWSQTHTA